SRDESYDHVEAGRLAGAVRSEQADHLSALDLQRNAIHHCARLEALAQVFCAQDAHFAAAAAGGQRGAEEALPGSAAGALGCSTAVTRLGVDAGAALFAVLTEKNSVRWSRKM